jgi:galactosylxylosylprotein 3-beta-galactosyltransferase
VIRGAELFIAMISHFGNHERRNEIRNSWRLWLDDRQVLRFFVAVASHPDHAALGPHDKAMKLLQAENATHGDLVFLDMEDDYANALTVKVLACLAYAYEHVDYAYLLKIDDDSYFDPRIFRRVVRDEHRVPTARLFWGMFQYNDVVWDPDGPWGRWAVRSYPPCDSYLPYAYGGGYLLSRDLVEFVVTESRYLLSLRIEDAAMGTWLAGLDITRKHDFRFDAGNTIMGCADYKMLMHKRSSAVHYKLAMETGSTCPDKNEVPGRLKDYDWTRKPSECCPLIDGSRPQDEQR